MSIDHRMRLSTLLFASLLALPASGQPLSSMALSNPAPAGSLEPNWSVTPEGALVLSWIEPAKDGTAALRYAVRRGAAWSESHVIVDKRHFFRHPAEVPAVMATSTGHWLAHWVEMPDPSNEAEYIYVSSSEDGAKWSVPASAHRDRSPVQHGLVSMIPDSVGGASLFFLQSLKGEDGPTSLMRSVISAAGKEVREERLDNDVCSCCPTAVAKTGKGLLLAYRDHTPADIRDISVMRFESDKWIASKTLNADNWQINACPINAAAVAASGDHVAVAWFTAAQNSPRVLMAFSSDNGMNFSKPVAVSTGHAHGYTSIVIDERGNAIVSWIEQGSGGSRVLVRRINSAGAAGPVLEIAKGDRSALGYPKLARVSDEIFIAWGGAKVQISVIH
jgi:hypothetical protein